jgi:nickel-type superoxide dismutase maturation protease
MLQIMKVTGESLSPFFETGDYVLIVKVPFLLLSLQVGDILVFHHPVYGMMIKRLEQVSPDGTELFLLGTHPESTDSREFGPVARKNIIGKVIWHIPRPRK